MSSSAFFHVLTDELKLLAIDDDPIQREFAGVYLASPSATVTTVADGQAGLDLIVRDRFDVVLLDIDMPGMSGFDVLDALRRDPRTESLPVIVITGREDIASIDRAYELGATSFVSKPVNWRILAYQIRYVLRADRRVATTASALAA